MMSSNSNAFTAESSSFPRKNVWFSNFDGSIHNRHVRSCFTATTSSLFQHRRPSSLNSAYLPSPILHRRSQLGEKGRTTSLMITNSYKDASDVVKDIAMDTLKSDVKDIAVDTLKSSIADLGKFLKGQHLAFKILAMLTTVLVTIVFKIPEAMWEGNIKKFILFLSKVVREAVPFVWDPKFIFVFVVAAFTGMGFVIGSKSGHLKGKDATRIGGSGTGAQLEGVAGSGHIISYYHIDKVDNFNVYNSDVSKPILPPIPPSGA